MYVPYYYYVYVDYLSGLFNQLYLHPDKSPATDAWRYEHEQGNSTCLYLQYVIFFIQHDYTGTCTGNASVYVCMYVCMNE